MGRNKSGFEEAMMSRKHVTPKINNAKPGVKISDDEWLPNYLPIIMIADSGELMSMKIHENGKNLYCQVATSVDMSRYPVTANRRKPSRQS